MPSTPPDFEPAAEWLDLLPTPLAVVDRDGQIKRFNRDWAHLLRYSQQELSGWSLPGLVIPEDRARLQQALGDLSGSHPEFRLELRCLSKPGHQVSVVMTARLAGEAYALVALAALDNEQADSERRREQHQSSMRLESVGRLAGGVAHDFNNLLTVISGHTELLLDQLAEGDPLREEVTEIKKAADRATALTRQLLAFGRRQVLTPRVLEFDALLTRIEPVLRRVAGGEVEIDVRRSDEGARIKADPAQLEDVLVKLALRARDSMTAGGHLTIENRRIELRDDYLHGHPVKRGLYLMIRVSDSGPTLDAESRAHVFEPFFKAAHARRGTDLGLATVYGIVKQSGGYIWVAEAAPHGTAFEILLPLAEGEQAAMPAVSAAAAKPPATERAAPRREAPAAATSAGQPGGRQTVLLVEDEDGIRWLARAVLQLNGYAVIEARDGNEALTLSAAHSGSIDLLLTDVVMPQMSGHELSRRITASHPETRVLYMSGYGDSTVVRQENGAAFLQKPFTGESLARKVREVLETRRAA